MVVPHIDRRCIRERSVVALLLLWDQFFWSHFLIAAFALIVLDCLVSRRRWIFWCSYLGEFSRANSIPCIGKLNIGDRGRETCWGSVSIYTHDWCILIWFTFIIVHVYASLGGSHPGNNVFHRLFPVSLPNGPISFWYLVRVIIMIRSDKSSTIF